MGISLRQGKVVWVQDLNGSTTATPFPALPTDGVVPVNPGGSSGSTIHFGADFTVTGGVMSATVSLYGYTQTGTFPGWKFLGSLNGGNSITNNTSTNAPSATQITVAEVFTCSGENYERYASRAITGGTNPLISTYVGFPME